MYFYFTPKTSQNIDGFQFVHHRLYSGEHRGGRWIVVKFDPALWFRQPYRVSCSSHAYSYRKPLTNCCSHSAVLWSADWFSRLFSHFTSHPLHAGATCAQQCPGVPTTSSVSAVVTVSGLVSAQKNVALDQLIEFRYPYVSILVL